LSEFGRAFQALDRGVVTHYTMFFHDLVPIPGLHDDPGFAQYSAK